MTDKAEVSWPNTRIKAKLSWHSNLPFDGDLWFTGPDGKIAAIPVTEGDSNEASQKCNTNVWHVDFTDTTVTVSPSIHFIGHWHSPNPVTFDRVEDDSWRPDGF